MPVSRAAVCLVTLTALAGGCSGASERSIIERFFSGSRLLDQTALGSVSDVVFDPRTQGVVTRFRIQGVSAGRGGARDVTIAADVRLPGGGTVRKTLVITLRPATAGADRRHPDTGQGWIVSAFKDAS
jgi:hypothetical protein